MTAWRLRILGYLVAAAMAGCPAAGCAVAGCSDEPQVDAGGRTAVARGGDQAEAVEMFRVSPRSDPPCQDDQPTPRAERTVRVRLVRGAGVTPAELAAQTSRAASFFAPHGLRFDLAGAPATSHVEVLVGAGEAQLTATLSQQGLAEAPEDDPRVAAVAADLVGRPVGAFLRSHSVPPRDEVVVVVLRRITGTRSIARRAFPHMTGATLVAERRFELSLLAPLLPEGFTPTVFISLDDIAELPSGVVDTVLAHEVGHALGLTHEGEPTNLMFPRPHRCLPRLTDTQMRQLVSDPPASP